jgi:hypothetical protein
MKSAGKLASVEAPKGAARSVHMGDYTDDQC